MQIARTQFEAIRAHLSEPEITLITGPRQSGKTTICRQLESVLAEEGMPSVYFNLDIEADYQVFETQDQFLFTLQNRFGTQRSVVFIDEFQRKENGGLFLKGLYDMALPYKFVVTGSGSIELKEQVHESLAGRKRVFELETVSFDEYLSYVVSDEMGRGGRAAYWQSYPDRFQLHLENYLTFGGYPKVILADGIEAKRSVLQEIYSSYLLKDITALLNIEKTAAFQRLVENLSILNGKLLNMSTLSRSVRVSVPTVERYLWYLEKTFVLKPVRPYSPNALREINRSSTTYFADIGLKNLISADFDLPSERVDFGFDFQNLVFLELSAGLREKQPASIHFWRTHDGAEVDLIVKKAATVLGIECKYTLMSKPEYTRSMRSFIEKYRPPRFYIVNQHFAHTEMIDQTEVIFLPVARLAEVTASL